MNENNGFKQKAVNFFEKNGFYVVLCSCLAVVGATAFFTFARVKDVPEAPLPVNQSTDQTLEQVQPSPLPMLTGFATPNPFPTPTPTATPENVMLPVPTPVLAGAVTPSATPQPKAAKKALFDAPVQGSVILPFATDSLVYSKTLNQWTSHNGIDIASTEGSAVKCIDEGVVAAVATDEQMGNTVIVTHKSYTSAYASLRDLPALKVGQSVTKGQAIGEVGASAISECESGAHLHFELRYKDKLVNPKDYLIGVTKLEQ